jgi:hypothetical protein
MRETLAVRGKMGSAVSDFLEAHFPSGKESTRTQIMSRSLFHSCHSSEHHLLGSQEEKSFPIDRKHALRSIVISMIKFQFWLFASRLTALSIREM